MKSPENIVRSIILLNVVAVFLIPISPSFATDTEPVGYVTGSVFNLLDQTPLAGATILLLGTPYGAMTDVNGEYLISNLQPGMYSLSVFCVGMGELTIDSVKISAGDTIQIDWELPAPGSFTTSRHYWDEFSSVFSAILEIRQNPVSSNNFDGLTIHADGQYFRESHVSEQVYRIGMPTGCFDIIWNLPSLGERVIEDVVLLDGSVVIEEINTSSEIITFPDNILETLKFPLTIADLTDDEWFSPRYELERILINPAVWGHDSLVNYGFVGARTFFDNTASGERWRVVMAFHKKIVVLAEDSERIVHILDIPTETVRFSPRGSYLLAFDCIWRSTFSHRGGDAVLINTETGNSKRFDPFPEYPEPDSIIPVIQAGFIHVGLQEPVFYPSDDGSLVAIGSESVWIYDLDMDFIEKRSLEGLHLDCVHSTLIRRRRSSNGDWIVATGTIKGNKCLFFIDRNGNLTKVEPLLHQMEMQTDIDCSEAIVLSAIEGIKAYNGQTGDHLWTKLDSMYVNNLAFSDDGSLIGYSIVGSYPGSTHRSEVEDHICEISNASNGLAISSFNAFTVNWTDGSIKNLSESGYCLLEMFSRDRYSERLTLLADDNSLLWLGPLRLHRTSRYEQNPLILAGISAISSDGRRFIYSDGYFIHVMTLTETSD